MNEELFRELFNIAVSKHGAISPCVNSTWEKCFMEYNGKVMLWFNDAAGSTHIVRK